MPQFQDYLTDPALGLVREARAPQLQMAASIEQVLTNGGAYFVEAPVATGKTFAYLVPALLAQGRRVVVATAKKQLQDQILEKDFPAIKRVFGRNSLISAVPLKGKSNYTCRLSAAKILEKNPAEEGSYRRFLIQSVYGDRAEYPGSPPRWWGGATAEDCVGRRCHHFSECGFMTLKRSLAQARLIVINHHVLGADMYYGMGKLLGGPYDVLIVDEAHALAAGIRSAFTHRVAEDSITSLNELIKRASSTFTSIRKLIEPWNLMFEAVPNKHFNEADLKKTPVFSQGLATEVLGRLKEVEAELDTLEKRYNVEESEHDDPLEDPEDYVDSMGEKIEAIEGGQEAVEQAAADTKDFALAIITQAQRRVGSLIKGLTTAQGIVEAAEGADPEEHEQKRERILANTAVFTSKDDRGRFGISCAPVNVGGIAGNYMRAIKTVVLCSATLAIDGRFDHVSSMTGLTPAKTEVLPTSFNYDAQGFAFIPRGMPVIGRKDEGYAEGMKKRVQMACDLVRLSDGGAFILTTANDELDMFAEALKDMLPGRVFAQGHRKNPWDGDPNAALAKFKATPDAVLIGSKSFWEGVDIPGGALRLVIMAKLPFAHPGDPIVKARSEQAGGSWFTEVALPDMLIDLRQGIGRLIRTVDDRGCAVILDSRVWTEPRYGGPVRRALPWSNNLVTSDFSVCERIIPKQAAYFRRQAQSQAFAQ